MAELKIPAGYKLIPEDLYNNLMALMSQGPVVTAKAEEAKHKKYYKVVVPDLHLGHNKLTVHKGDILEYVPGDYFKYGGTKYNNIESFTTILRVQREGKVKSPFLVEVSESALYDDSPLEADLDDDVRISKEENAEPSMEHERTPRRKKNEEAFDLDPDTDIADMDNETKKRFIHANGTERLENSIKTGSGFQVEARETPDDIKVIPPLHYANKSVATVPGPPADERAMSVDEMSHQQGRSRARKALK